MFRSKRNAYVLFEHPAGADTWKLDFIQDLLDQPGMMDFVTHMCCFGLSALDSEGPGLVRKSTRLATNSPYMARKLQRSCSGDHRHVHLLEGRAAAAAKYTPEFCQAIVSGLRAQRRADCLARTQP